MPADYSVISTTGSLLSKMLAVLLLMALAVNAAATDTEMPYVGATQTGILTAHNTKRSEEAVQKKASNMEVIVIPSLSRSNKDSASGKSFFVSSSHFEPKFASGIRDFTFTIPIAVLDVGHNAGGQRQVAGQAVRVRTSSTEQRQRRTKSLRGDLQQP